MLRQNIMVIVMKYSEVQADLFSVDDTYHLAHCISCDAAMGKGIAVKFVSKFPALKKLRSQHLEVGDCKLVGRVLNLITKKSCYGKPTYSSLEESLKYMKEICINENISKVAMPCIASGLDRLSWPEVSEIIQEVFKDTDIEILVCIV